MSKYTWGTPGQLEEAIASGRMNNEILAAHPGLSVFSESGRIYGALAEIVSSTPTDSLNVRSFGAKGDGVTDDTAAIQAALTTADGRGSATVWFPAGAYIVTAPLIVGGFTSLVGTGHFGSLIYKTHTGDCFQIAGNFVHFRDMSIHGNVAVSPTYGTSGTAVYWNTTSTGEACTWEGGGIQDCDFMFRFTTDAGHSFRCTSAYLRPYNITPGTETNAIWIEGDTSAAFRQFVNCILFSRVYLRGALDTMFSNCILRHFDTDAATSILLIQGCVLANSDNAWSLSGDNISVIGCRLSGAVTLNSGSNGAWVGNIFTSGAVTDNSGNINNWQILHRIEGSSLVTWLAGSRLRHGTVGIIHPDAVQSVGDNALSTTTTGTPTKRILMFKDPISTPRQITLNTGADYKNGDTYEIYRTAAATGASAVNVGSGPLKALAVGQWCKVVYDGSTWYLSMFGSL